MIKMVLIPAVYIFTILFLLSNVIEKIYSLIIEPMDWMKLLLVDLEKRLGCRLHKDKSIKQYAIELQETLD